MFSITMRSDGDQARTVETTRSGAPHMRNRMVISVPASNAAVFGRYSVTAGSITVALDGSAKNRNA